MKFPFSPIKTIMEDQIITEQIDVVVIGDRKL